MYDGVNELIHVADGKVGNSHDARPRPRPCHICVARKRYARYLVPPFVEILPFDTDKVHLLETGNAWQDPMTRLLGPLHRSTICSYDPSIVKAKAISSLVLRATPATAGKESETKRTIHTDEFPPAQHICPFQEC